MRRLVLGALLAAAAALVAACGSTGTGAGTASEAAGAPPGFDAASCVGNVAVMAPYGGFGAADTVQMNWARVALEKFNQDHGTGFGFVPANADADPDDAVEQARRVSGDRTVFGVVGPKTSVATRAAGPVFDAAGLVYVSPSATNATLTDGSLRNFYRVVASDALQAPTMGEFIAKQLEPSGVLIVRDDEAYSQGLVDGLTAKLDELGVPYRVADIAEGQRDFDDLVLQVDPTVDVVALPILRNDDALGIVAALRRAGKDPEFVGGDALFLKSFEVPGAYVTTYAPDASARADAADVVALYQSIFGDFEQFGAPAYVAMEVVLQAAYDVCLRGDVVDRDSVLREVPKVRLEQSMLGRPVAFTRDHELEGATIQVYQVSPSGFALVQ